MRITSFPLTYGGLFCMIFISRAIQGQDLLYSGSGDDTPSVFNAKEEVEGSGSTQTPLVVRPYYPKLPVISDDEDVNFGSGDDPVTVVEGSGTTESTESEYKKCTDSLLYCWCINVQGIEIPGTRLYLGAEIGFHLNCDEVISAPVAPISTDMPSTTLFLQTERTSIKPFPQTQRIPTIKPIRGDKSTSASPYVVDADHTDVKRPPPGGKFDKPTTTEKVGEGVDSNGQFRDDEDFTVVEKKSLLPLFTHPGILAAIIGGGVVALLCALLLVMFIVYRMRKKDEGSYPLDPAAKPRLHVYTRAPSKEIYA